MKTLCPTHRLFYVGNECPLCRQERIERYKGRFCKIAESKETSKEREITEDDLEKLRNKFKQTKL